MPETSQDAFETMFPAKQPVSAQELRIRSNSVNKNNKPINFQIDNTLVAAESNFWPISASQLGVPRGSRGPRESRVSVGDVDSCYTAPEPKGYKRESSHR